MADELDQSQENNLTAAEVLEEVEDVPIEEVDAFLSEHRCLKEAPDPDDSNTTH